MRCDILSVFAKTETWTDGDVKQYFFTCTLLPRDKLTKIERNTELLEVLKIVIILKLLQKKILSHKR